MLTRREVVRSGVLVAGALGIAPAFWRTARAASSLPVKPGPGPYGPLQPADANGIMLPKGFTSRVVAQGGVPLGASGYSFPIFPDGSATYATPDGGWILVVNSEIPSGSGGASAIRFNADGTIANAYRVLGGTSGNCAGGKTPWGTWMSCEEQADGAVWECDPTGSKPAVRHPVMGLFNHEAVAVDPDGQRLYLTEDDGAGGFYRFTPDSYPDCSKGRLEVAVAAADGKVRWVALPNAQGGSAQPTRQQVPEMTKFKRGEGIAFDAGVVYVATTSDHKLHAYDTRSERITVVYDAGAVAEPPLHNPDNVVVSPSGDIFIGEDDGGEDPLDLGLVTPEGEVARFLKLTGGQHGVGGDVMSEVTGPSFDPSGKRLYLSSQRAFVVGVVYEITGPFRTARAPGAPIGASPAPTPGPGSALAVEVARTRKRSQLLRLGLPVALTLDKAATVRVTIRAKLPGRKRPVVLARLSRRIDAGPEQLRLRLSKAGRARVRATRGRLRLTVEVRVGTRTINRATVVS